MALGGGALVAAVAASGGAKPFRWLGIWAALAFVLHLIWEIGHLPLYTLAQDPDRVRVAQYVLHCALGDVVIALAAYVVAALAVRTITWPLQAPWRGGAVALVAGIAYTAFSEWYNVYRLASWAYTPSMPLVGGIGLTPLLQWLLIPPAMIVVMRRVLRMA